MNKSFQTFMIAIPSVAIFANVAVAQPQTSPDKIPVKLQVVVSTYEGDRKVSSMPYTLLATANGGGVTFLAGTNVPLQGGDGKLSYTNIGTTITCTVTTEAGNFRLAINFDEKSVMAAKTPVTPAGPAPKPLESPTFHDVNYVGTVALKEGETKQLVSAPDKVSGEIIKIDVTLTLDPPRRATVELDNRDFRAARETTTGALPFSLN